MDIMPQAQNNDHALYHFKRPRLNKLFTEAVKYPLVVVCAGAGYGKTSAVQDFAREYQAATAWLQLSERDNSGERFWENYTHSVAQTNAPLAEAMTRLGFPDTKEKLNRYRSLLRNLVELKRRIIVMDDFHCIEEPSMITFFEECILNFIPTGTSVFIVSRSITHINIASHVYRERMFNINEDDLLFTESELFQYFREHNISPSTENLREIMQDTEGWAFTINLILRSYQKAPGYSGYVRNAIKTNIFKLIETEFWNRISENLKNFLIRLSLIDHLSADLIAKLSGNDKALLAEFEKQNDYIRLDNYINAYLIHPLFLEFLAAKQNLLKGEQKRKTYKIAGEWCNKNGFRIDALAYYEKAEDYQSIVKIFFELPLQIPEDIARFSTPIFNRVPEETIEKIEFLAEMHLRVHMCQGLWERSLELVKKYEAIFLKLPDEDIIKKRTLCRLYICWAYISALMGLMNDYFEFDKYFEKACKSISTSVEPGKLSPHCPGAWIICTGNPSKGLPEKYIEAVTRNQAFISNSLLRGFMAGEPELARGELEFYRGDAYSAEPYVTLAVRITRANKQYGLLSRALFYAMRVAAAQGNYGMAEQALNEIKDLMDEQEYQNRYIDYDISLSWYCCFLGMPEKTSDWLKEDFSTYSHPSFIDNFANQIKVRFCYATRNFPSLLSYIEEMKKRESFLFGRLEMLAIEACIHYKLKNVKKAVAVFEEAYAMALPNRLLMPFIELGKDMRTLTAAALKAHGKVIPKPWLEDLNRKSASYAKRRAHIIAEYNQARGITDSVSITPREMDILKDLSHGLSRVEIAAARNLSINTVKMVINSIFYKLGAENLADLIRIAVEKKLI